MFKVLCDLLSIRCTYERPGFYMERSHYYNRIMIDMDEFVVDLLENVGSLYAVNSEQAKRYVK